MTDTDVYRIMESLLLYCGISLETHCRVAEATLSGAWMMGNAFAFSGDLNRALNAANRVFQLLERSTRESSFLKMYSVFFLFLFDVFWFSTGGQGLMQTKL